MKKIIEVNSTKVAGSLSNYVALIQPSSMTGWETLTLAEAQSIRFYSNYLLTTELAREVVSANEIYVKIPSLTTTTVIYADYDGIRADYTASDTYGRNNVWTDYQAVHHFEANSNDSTSNARNGTDTNISYGTGKLGNAAYNTSKNGKIALPSFSLNSAFSVTTWVKMDVITGVQTLFSTYDGVTNGTSTAQAYLSTGDGKPIYSNFVTDSSPTGATVISAGAWAKVDFTHDGTTVRIYINGVEVDTGTVGHVTTSQVFTYMSRNDESTQRMDGYLDEARITNSQLSANWIQTEYSNQADVSTFWEPVEDYFVTTDSISSIGVNTATGNATAHSNNGSSIIERGFCWNTSPNPIYNDNKVSENNGLGAYSLNLTGLISNTTYYVRSFIRNSVDILYGNQLIFTTLPIDPNDIIWNIEVDQGQTILGQINVTGTTGTITVKLGSTGTQTIISAGAGTTTFEGTYSGTTGLIITRSSDFDGTVDNVYYTLVPLDTVVDWSLEAATIVTAIDSSVFFKRIEDDVFNSFRFYRYLDLLFKDLDGFVTVTVRDEREDITTEREKTFSVGNVSSGTVSPFQKKRISFLIKPQAVIIGLSNANKNETFSIAQFLLTGHKKPQKMFSPGKINSMG